MESAATTLSKTSLQLTYINDRNIQCSAQQPHTLSSSKVDSLVPEPISDINNFLVAPPLSQAEIAEKFREALKDGFAGAITGKGSGSAQRLLIDDLFVKMEVDPNEFLGANLMHISGENVPTMISVQLNTADSEIIRGCFQAASEPLPAELSKVSVMPLISGKDFTNMEKSFFAEQDNINFLSRELGRIIIKDLCFCVTDRMIGNPPYRNINLGNVMIRQFGRKYDLSSLCVIDIVFDESIKRISIQDQNPKNQDLQQFQDQ